jgi:hypothetical protein
MSSKGGPTGKEMKAVGRNMARANNQKSSSAAPKKYAAGGPVQSSGQSRGNGAAIKGKKFEGVF